MDELFSAAPSLLLTVVVGYLLGALPLADQISRRHGVDIFTRGTGLAGTTNVRKSVGNLPGLMVLIGDVGKGALAVIFARAIGVEGPWVLLCPGAAVVGHWLIGRRMIKEARGLRNCGCRLLRPAAAVPFARNRPIIYVASL